jgi:hypothetical protein
MQFRNIIKENFSYEWLSYEIFEVFTAVTMKNGVFGDVTPSGSYKNRRFRGTLAVTSNRCTLRRNANAIPRSPILITLMMEVLSSSETLVLKEPHGVTTQKTPFFNLCKVRYI